MNHIRMSKSELTFEAPEKWKINNSALNKADLRPYLIDGDYEDALRRHQAIGVGHDTTEYLRELAKPTAKGNAKAVLFMVLFDRLWDKMFTKRYGGNDLSSWHITFSQLRIDGYKEFIFELVINGKRVKTGYTCSSMIRGVHEYHVYWK